MTLQPRSGRPALSQVRRSPIELASDELVRVTAYSERPLPTVVRPSCEGVSLEHWIAGHRDEIDPHLLASGALLFRDFSVRGQEGFEKLVDALGFEKMHYLEGATPRTEVSNRVYTSTEFPPEHHIALHNELSYVMTWPMRICFFCITPPAADGETPIADVRRVLARIKQDVKARFLQYGWMLVRNYGDGFGLPWRRAFRTDARETVETYCAENHISWEWRDNDRLRTQQVRPAISTHPVTGEKVWFNHIAFWHSSSLPPDTRALLLAEYGAEGIPYNTFYGDGSSIEDATVEELRGAYDEETVAVPWQQGDLLLLDNMLAAHGRRPFTGTRRIVVSMGAPFTRMEW